MASAVPVLLLTVSLILSRSITLATVDLALDQDGAVCGGEMATLKCTTTTLNGFLEWSINSSTVFTIGETATVGTSQTVDGSFFNFTKTDSVPGAAVVYTSTVSLNTLVTRTVQCTDSLSTQSRTVDLRVVYSIFNESSTINGNVTTISWSKPINSGVCCDRYLVEPSTGATVTVTTPSYDIEHNASISVRCMDQLGTLGPKVDYRADITNQNVFVSTPGPVGDFSDGIVMYRANLTLSECGESVFEIMDCSIVGMAGNCSISQNAVFFQISGFSAFELTLTFTYESGFSISQTVSGPDTSILERASRTCGENYYIHFIVTFAVGIILILLLLLLLIAVVVLTVTVVVLCKKKNQASPKADLQHELHDLDDKTKL